MAEQNSYQPSIRPYSAKSTLSSIDFSEHVQRKSTFPRKKIVLIGALVLVVVGVIAGIVLGIVLPKNGKEAFKTSEDNLGGTGSTESPQFTATSTPTTPSSKSTGSVDKTTSSVETSSTALTTPSSRSTGSIDETTSSIDTSSTAPTTPPGRSTGSVDETTSSVDTSSTVPTTPSSRSTGSVDVTTSSVDTSSTAPTTPSSRSTGSVDVTTSSVDTSSTAPTTPPSRSTGSVDETTSSVDTSSTAPTTRSSISTGSADETTSSVDTFSTASTTTSSGSSTITSTTTTTEETLTNDTITLAYTTGEDDLGATGSTVSPQLTATSTPMTASSRSTGPVDETTSSIDTFSTASTPPSGSSTITSSTTTTEATPTDESITFGSWAPWGDWTTCTATCGGGIYKRYRTCTQQSDTDYPCSGDSVETAVCNDLQCPQTARWSTWGLWGRCGVTCGGDTQTRDRVCQSDDSTSCVGNPQMSQTCNDWVCPDCNQGCSVGSLNVQCDACICDTTLTITVKTDITSIPVYGASIFLASAPTKEIAVTDGSGQVTLTTVCLNAEIHVSRDGFQTRTAQVTSTPMDLTLSVLEYPHFTEVPKSKSRLSGEDVTFCCIASASPAVTYYEWFRNGVLLDTDLYPNGTHITLPSLILGDSGEYTCRANSPIGAIKSDVATLQVRGSSDGFCSDAFEQRRIQLPSDCNQPDTNSATYGVGSCNPQKCRQSGATDNATCGEDSNSCCKSSLSELVEVQCSGYVLDIMVIKACGCSSCTERSVTLSGTALAYDDSAPLKYGEIWLNGVKEGYTSILGTFSLSLTATLTTHTITLRDTSFKDFLEMTKTITITEGISTLSKTFKLLRASDPVQISTSVENTLQLGPDGNNASSSVASITIPPNAFYTSDGTPYTGTVDARLTFVSMETVPDVEAVPGTFVVINEEGEEENLVSVGVFSLTFQEQSGNDLNVGENIDVELNTDTIGDTASSFNLYGLDSITGKWVEIKKPQSQRKRRYAVFGEVNVNEYKWFNLDRVSVNQWCYLRANVYETQYVGQTPLPSIVSFSLRMTYIVFINDVTFAYYRSYGRDGCFKIACDGHTGLIDIYSYTYRNYSMPLDPSLEYNEFKNYTVSSNGRVANVTLSPTNDGPFFNVSAVCKTSNPSSVMHFNLPSDSRNIYTFKPIKGPLDGFPGNQLSNETEERVWYVDKICMIKATFSGYYQNVKVRAMSERDFSGNRKLFGIREIFVSDIKGIGVACLEYRCSQDNDKKTKVIVSPVSSHYIRCTIDHQNGSFQGDQTGERSFIATLPVSFKSEDGLYDRDLNRIDFTTVQEILNDNRMKTITDECKSGGEAKDANSNKAIHFNCVYGLG